MGTTTYFHYAPVTLAPGSIIQPGNWGRILALYETNNTTQVQLNVIREALIELARPATKPSRLECVFAVPTLGEAIKFRNQHQRLSVIHEVIPVDDATTTHVGDYEIAITPFVGRYMQLMIDFARSYWTVTQPQNPEILFSCPIQVVAVPSVPPLP